VCGAPGPVLLDEARDLAARHGYEGLRRDADAVASAAG